MKVKQIGENIQGPSSSGKKSVNYGIIYGGGGLLFVIIIVLLYFFVIRPAGENTAQDNRNDDDIKKKELDLKEKELQLREKELGLQNKSSEITEYTPISGGVKKFKGAFFEINYPDNFTARPSLEHTGSGGYKSAYFSSPDGLVEYYVFSAWHDNVNNEIDFLPDKETIEQNETNRPDEYTEVKYVTYSAIDGSYKRSYMDMLKNGERTVFGYKYRNTDAYNYYKNSYLNFKKSLVEFGD